MKGRKKKTKATKMMPNKKKILKFIGILSIGGNSLEDEKKIY